MNYYFLLVFFCFGFLFDFRDSVLITGIFDEQKALKEANDPSKHDLLLTDLPIDKMKAKTKEVFGFDYDSPTQSIGEFPIQGIILKDSLERLIFPVVILYKKKRIRTTCVLDTGSPFTFLSAETFRDVGIVDVPTTGGVNLSLQGLPITVYLSINHFSDINLCGQSFFGEHKLRVTVDYRSRKLVIEETPKLTPAQLEEL